VVDDEASIRKTLEAILRDEGADVLLAGDGESALSMVVKQKPDLVLLDIWLPGRDGLETLERLKRIAPDVAVIMISGHATIATAIMATRMGAVDFIEKPLDMHLLVQAARRALHRDSRGGAAAEAVDEASGSEEGRDQLAIGREASSSNIRPVVFERHQPLAGRRFPQRTLAHSTLLYGQGLHSGKKSGLILEPLPPGSGIHFVSVSETTAVPAHVDFVESTGFATTVRLGRTQAGTIEHLMSALHAYGICNLLIKCNGEVPVMDGSSREFCALIEQTGIEEQDADWFEIEVKKPIRVGKGREFIQLEPGDEFVVDYTLDYPAPVGRQQMSFRLSDIEAYKRDIAPARTFGFVKDIGMLQRQGLALGGRFDNFVLFGDEGPINDQLRFPDEPVRHKILDAIGDLFLLGRRIRGKVTACMTGHSDNISLLRALREELR
jgi:UDP-3-O-acyl N-acetylglucosamine deacetylase